MKKHKILNKAELEQLFKEDISEYQFGWDDEPVKEEEKLARLYQIFL